MVSDRFISTVRGFVNLSHVASMRLRRGQDGILWVLLDANETELGEVADPREGMETLLAPVVPASPGAAALVLYCDAEGDKFPTENDIYLVNISIVAWRILSPYLGAAPVFVDEPGANGRVFVREEGHLTERFAGTYETEEDAKSEVLRSAQYVWHQMHPSSSATAGEGTPE